MPRGRMDADQRREQIVRISTRLFADNGTGGTRFWQIASACGISEGAIMHSFRNKEALHAACFRQAVLETLPTMSRIPEGTEEALVEYARTFLAQCRKNPASLRFILHINLSEPGNSEIFYESLSTQGHLGQIETIIRRGSEFRKVSPTDISFSARAFIGILFMLAILHEFYQSDAVNRLSETNLAASSVELFLNGLRLRSPFDCFRDRPDDLDAGNLTA